MRAFLVASLVASACFFASPAHAAAPTVTNGCTKSVPEPGTTAPVSICYSLFRPASADAAHRVPLIIDSHGWAGSRMKDAGVFGPFLGAGFGVLSFDQRGFGQSGGKAHFQHPDIEGQDVQRVIDVVAGLDWVVQQAPGDPLIGAMGGSYGGAYQYQGAFTEIRDRGATRFDALAPAITWWDAKEALAPSEVARTVWMTDLWRAAIGDSADELNAGFAYVDATGDWPKGLGGVGPNLDALLAKNGPAWHVAHGRRLDIPVLIRQGITDTLFNLNEGLKAFDRALTPAARARSIFIGFNGGHVKPTVLPLGMAGVEDPCSKEVGGDTYTTLEIRFFTEVLKGQPTGLSGQGLYHLATAGDRCITVASDVANTAVPIGQVVASSGPGAPRAWKVADGPITIAGTPTVDAVVTSAAYDARLFLALSVGASAATARIVQDNLLPLRLPTPATADRHTIELPAVAVEVPAGQSLFLTVTPVSDLSIGHGSRSPGAVVLDHVVVHLPKVL